MTVLFRFILFLIINFLALGLGGLFTGKGVVSDWYQHLNKAPWTPPGWVFGAAWTAIMVCLSFYMTRAWTEVSSRQYLLTLFILQFVFNVIWNPVFFYLHFSRWALLIIILLAIIVFWMLISFLNPMKGYSLLLIPYGLWLLIAISLNAYIVFKN